MFMSEVMNTTATNNVGTKENKKVAEAKKKVQRSIRQQLESAKNRYEALQKQVIIDDAKKKMRDFSRGILQNEEACKMISKMTPTEAKYFGEFVSQHMNKLSEASATRRAEGRKHDMEVAEKRKEASAKKREEKTENKPVQEARNYSPSYSNSVNGSGYQSQVSRSVP